MRTQRGAAMGAPLAAVSIASGEFAGRGRFGFVDSPPVAVAVRQPDFDRVAQVYRWAEYLALGRTLERAREFFLPRLTECTSVLALGDGDGRFLARILRQNPNARAVAIDTSASMLALLQGRCGARVKTVRASALEVKADAGTDLVVTHFFLDCLTQSEVNALVASLAAQLEPGALWLVSDFGVPRTRWLRPFAAAYVRSLYLAFRILTGLQVTRLPDPQQAFVRSGLKRLGRHEFLFGLLYAELWQYQ
jgi:ubiquinone/menaquinone biosynthesis C-methylase UbiE